MNSWALCGLELSRVWDQSSRTYDVNEKAVSVLYLVTWSAPSRSQLILKFLKSLVAQGPSHTRVNKDLRVDPSQCSHGAHWTSMNRAVVVGSRAGDANPPPPSGGDRRDLDGPVSRNQFRSSGSSTRHRLLDQRPGPRIFLSDVRSTREGLHPPSCHRLACF